MKKELQRLDYEARYCGHENFPSQLIDGYNNLVMKRSPEEADEWFDEQMAQIYKNERIYMVVMMHNAAMIKNMGVTYSETADNLFARLCQLWYNY